MLLFLATSFIRCANDGMTITGRDYPRLKTLPVSDISDSGAVFNAEIIYRGNFKIVDYGFVWSENENPNLENSDKVVYSDNIQSNRFSSVISTALKSSVKYYVRPFILTDDYTVYGINMDFLSLGSKAPKIRSFFPKTGIWGDTIRIIGNNFSYLINSNTVKMGELSSEVISASDTVLAIKVPALMNNPSVKLKVSILGNTAISVDDFNYLEPKITSVEPLKGTFDDTVTIIGENLGRIAAYSSVCFGDANAKIVSASSSRICVLVPEEIKTKKSLLNITTVGCKFQYNQTFNLNPPAITSIEPKTITRPDEIITIKGMNFNPNALYDSIQVEGRNIMVTEANRYFLRVQISEVIPYYVSTFKDVTLKVKIAPQSDTFSSNLKIYWQSTWTRKADFPGAARYYATAFSANGKGYFGTGLASDNATYLNDFWKYDPSSDTWVQIKDFPGRPRAKATSFAISDEGYVGLGSCCADINYAYPDDIFSDFYKYNPTNGTWMPIAGFRGTPMYTAASFVINGLGYIATGYKYQSFTNVAWKYDPLANQWTQIASLPMDDVYRAVGFNIGDTGYVYNCNKLYKLSNNNWIQLKVIQQNDIKDNVAFSIGNLAYFGLGFANDLGEGTINLWEYNPLDETFLDRPLYAAPRYGTSAFVIDNKAYIIGGATIMNGQYIRLKDVWEFDPTKPAL